MGLGPSDFSVDLDLSMHSCHGSAGYNNSVSGCFQDREEGAPEMEGFEVVNMSHETPAISADDVEDKDLWLIRVPIDVRDAHTLVGSLTSVFVV